MMVDRKTSEGIRERYPKGTQVMLVQMDDVQAPPAGTLGRVVHVDDIGTIHIAWENGSNLGAVYGEDKVEIV